MCDISAFDIGFVDETLRLERCENGKQVLTRCRFGIRMILGMFLMV